MQAYITSDVVMDIAAFKVSHSVGCDIDATALQAARGEVKLHGGDGTLHKGEHAPNLQSWSRCLSWSELPCRKR